MIPMTDHAKHRANVLKALANLKGIEPERVEILVDIHLRDDPETPAGEIRKRIEAALADSPQAREAAALEVEKAKGKGKR